jgi:hypothetical protein
LAIPYSLRGAFGTAEQQARMEAESEMKVGPKSYKILGQFPPTRVGIQGEGSVLQGKAGDLISAALFRAL